jgi:hypothetical protein
MGLYFPLAMEIPSGSCRESQPKSKRRVAFSATRLMQLLSTLS